MTASGLHLGFNTLTSPAVRDEASAHRWESLVTELQAADTEELAGFLGSVFGGEFGIWQSRFAHWWTLNPVWRSSIPRGWLVRSTAGSIIAFTANIPFLYVIDGEPALCCATGSTAVDQNWRGLGLAKAVGQKFLDQSEADLLLGTDSTDVAHGLWCDLGMKSLQQHWLRTNFRILADGHAVAAGLSQRAGVPNVLGHAAGRCLTIFLGLPQMRRSTSLDVAMTDAFADSDAQNIESCTASTATTYARRDIRILNWLYFGTRHLKQTRAVFVARSGSRLVGYLAMKHWHGHSYYLLECRCQDADPAIARELMLAAREFAQRKQAQAVVVRPYARMIEMAIPATVSIGISWPRTTYCYQSRTDKLNINGWEVTPGDGDVSVN